MKEDTKIVIKFTKEQEVFLEKYHKQKQTSKPFVYPPFRTLRNY